METLSFLAIGLGALGLVIVGGILLYVFLYLCIYNAVRAAILDTRRYVAPSQSGPPAPTAKEASQGAAPEPD